MPPTPARFRDRRHAETVAEIKEIALRCYADGGAEGLSLRATAREMGLSVQALYHYFRSRDDLLTALIADGYAAVADAVAAGRDAAGPDRRAGMIGAALAYRQWAVAQPHVFRLLYGDLVPGYRAPAGGPTAGGGRRVGREFLRACFPGRSDAEVEPELARGVEWWAQLHGLVSLEVFGHLAWTGRPLDGVYRDAVENLADRVEAATATGGIRSGPG